MSLGVGLISRSNILDALMSGSFVPFYQPIVKSTGNVVGGEILARMKDINGEVIDAGHFIGSVTRFGLLPDMTEMILNKSMSEILRLAKVPNGFFITLNASLNLLMDDTFCDNLIKYCCELKFKGIKLIVEVTEHENVFDYDFIDSRVSLLRNVGVIFAVDDFGTGFANEDLLHRLGACLIKIDKKYTQDVNCLESKRFINHVMNLSLNLSGKQLVQVLAEGVESHEQETSVRKSGVDYFQGYLYYPALPFESFSKVITSC